MIDIVRQIWHLAKPYGVARLWLVLSVNILQAVVQVLGVASIFPFLAVAAGPQRINNSTFGQVFLDFFPNAGERELLVYSGGIAIAGLLLANLINIFSEFYRNRYAHRYGHWLRERLLSAYLERGYLYFTERNYSILHKKLIGDVMNYVVGVLLPALDIAGRVLVIALLGVLLFFVDPVIAVFTLGFFLTVYVLLFSWLRPLRERHRDVLKVANRGASFEALQFFSGIKAILIFDVSRYFVERYLKHSRRQAEVLAVMPLYGNFPRYLIEPLAFGGLVAYVLYLISQDRAFSDVLPNLGVIALAASRILPSLQLLYAQFNQLSVMKYSMEELQEEFDGVLVHPNTLIKDSDSISESVKPWEHSVEYRQVGFQYPADEKRVINKLDLTIEKGDRIVLMGESGAGKSTLIDLFLGLRQPTEGVVLIDAKPLETFGTKAWQQAIGYVPQDIYLLDGTVLENIAFGEAQADINLDRVQKACATAQIDQFIAGLPQGLETVVGDRGENISGGQRQRIGIARALYRQPKILVLDEATSALDKETEIRLIKSLADLPDELTILMITHRPINMDRVTVYEVIDGAVRKKE